MSGVPSRRPAALEHHHRQRRNSEAERHGPAVMSIRFAAAFRRQDTERVCNRPRFSDHLPARLKRETSFTRNLADRLATGRNLSFT